MRLTYDREADAAYLRVAERSVPGGAAYQVEVPHVDVSAGEFILDLDSNGRLVGVEILFASHALPLSVLADAEAP